MVEHSAVNRVVAGSSPARGAVAVATEARKHQRLRAFCNSIAGNVLTEQRGRKSS